MRRWLAALAVLSACAPEKPPAGVPDAPRAAEVTAKPAPSEPAPASATAARPRLVVWLTVDQLRGDSFSRFAHLISPNGFGWLLAGGLHFRAATYFHAITETAPGHATLFTGASPRDHGIIANEWLTAEGRLIPSVLDEAAPLLSVELDPSETLELAGRSPRRLLLPTVGDAFRKHTHGQSRVAAVSLKDRGAILPGGQAGLAFWLGKRGFVTSRHYASEVPPLLVQHAQRHPLSSYVASDWSLLLAEDEYKSALERPALGTRVDARTERFPHRHSPGTSEAAWLKTSPAGDRAVIDLAMHACEALALGQDDVVDLLAISLSANDYVGHLYGPESREAEDLFARLDRLLGEFFAFIATQVPGQQVLYVLSADHGIGDSPESRIGAGLAAGRITEAELESEIRRLLRAAHGHERFLRGLALPNVYLDKSEIARSGQDLRRVAERLAEELSQSPGVYEAYVSSEQGDDSEVGQRVLASLRSERSGELYLVFDPELQLADGIYAATHGSPWHQDRHVPIVLRGPGVPPGTMDGPVDVRALAGTVADLAGLPAPAGSHPERLLSARPRAPAGD